MKAGDSYDEVLRDHERRITNLARAVIATGVGVLFLLMAVVGLMLS